MATVESDIDAALDPAPDEINELGEACVRFVHEALGLRLDYSQETLPILDHYLKQRAAGAPAEVAELVAPAAGAYFGEVVRRTVSGARWHAPSGDYRDHRIEFEGFFLAFNPMGVAMEVLTGEDAEGWGAHFQVLDEARVAVEESLERAAEVETGDYYTFSLRLEVLEQIADLLLSLESHQPSPRHFGPDVYRAADGKRSLATGGPPS
jgi:hypothetical protein